MKNNSTYITQQAAERYGRCLYWHIRRLVVCHDDAEDALQETFLKIYTKAESFKGDEASLLAWSRLRQSPPSRCSYGSLFQMIPAAVRLMFFLQAWVKKKSR